MATPTLWLSEFQANTGVANTPTVSDTQILGLSNGNFLVAWTESGTGAGVGTQAGTDIIGKIYDGEGNVVRDSYRINFLRNADNEADFDIAATNDGGFMLVYVDNDIANPDESAIVWERKNSLGDNTHDTIIVSETNSDDYDNPQIVVNNNDNSSHVIYTDLATFGIDDDDIRGVELNSVGTIIVTETDFAQNTGDDERQGSVAINTNGEIVTVHRNVDDGEVIVNVRTAAGTLLHTAVVDDTGNPNDPHVATLSNGNIAVVWTDDIGAGSSGDVNRAVYNSNLGVVQSKLSINNTDANEAQIVALPTGGFVVVWDDDNAGTNDIRAQKFTSTGATDGSQVVVDTSAGSTPSVSVTGDGRVLFTWNSSSNANVSIWDPRDGNISTASFDSPQEQFVDGDIIYAKIAGGLITGDSGTADTIIGSNNLDTINGNGDNDTIEGRGGNDIITGGTGNDFIDGGSGNDSINGGAGVDTIDGGANNDSIFLSDGDNIDNVDGGTGADTLNLINLVGITDAVSIDMNTNTWTGRGGTRSIDSIETVIGTQEADTILGDAAAQTLNGFDGNDTISGGFGNDSLNGQNGIDTVDYSYDPVPLPFGGVRTINLATGSSSLAPLVIGGATTDIDTLSNFENVIGSGHRDVITGTSGTNVISGGGGNDTITAGQGTDTVNGDAGDDLFIDNDSVNVSQNDEYNGGSGTDTVRYTANFSNSVAVDLLAQNQTFGGVIRDKFTSVENVEVAGSETVTGSSGDNALTATGLTQANTMTGGGGSDTLKGGGGNDDLDGGDGADFVNGQDGDDILRDTGSFSGASNLDAYDGGDGIDTFIHILSWNSGVTFDLLAGVASFNGVNADTFVNIENITVGGQATVIGSLEDNVITIDDIGLSNNVIKGNAGDDTINAGIGDDILNGGLGADTLNGGTGTDTASYEDAAAGLIVDLNNPANNTGEAAGDTYSSIENLIGSNFGDGLTGSNNANGILGGSGNDVLNGLGGDDVLSGGFSQDMLFGGAGNDRLNGGFGNDTLDGGADNDTAVYTGFNGSITVNLNTVGAQDTGAAGIDTLSDIENLSGASFNDRFTGGVGANGDNILDGNAGSDLLFGLGGNDTLNGGLGNDNIQGGAGEDIITGGLGRDIMRGGTGNDLFVFNDIAESVVGGQRSRIDNFSVSGADGNETVDISGIDANTGVGGNQAFSFIGQAAFTNTAGELRFFSAPGPRRIAEGDVDGDGNADFQIEFFNFNTILIASDFIL